VERVGGFLNAFTEKEVLCCYCTLPAEDLELAMDVLADMYFHSILDPREIEKEKAVVINEIQTAEDNPEEKAHQLYLEGLWNGHELSRKITGESTEVSAISRERLASFYRERFSGEHTVVTASGSLEPEALLAPELALPTSRPGRDRRPSRARRWSAGAPGAEARQVRAVRSRRQATPAPARRGLLPGPGFQHPVRRAHDSRLFQTCEDMAFATWCIPSIYFWTSRGLSTPAPPPPPPRRWTARRRMAGCAPTAHLPEVEDARARSAGGSRQEDMENRMKACSHALPHRPGRGA
jgi:hypothetical protein